MALDLVIPTLSRREMSGAAVFGLSGSSLGMEDEILHFQCDLPLDVPENAPLCRRHIVRLSALLDDSGINA
jgi:hypothetical protein